jgi:hypothetical protein
MKVVMLEHPKEEDWFNVKARALVTIGKKAINMPHYDWKIKMLNCRHSPIRKLFFSFYISDMPYWLHAELCRHHIGIEKYVKSQRDDRNNNDIPRGKKPQDAPVDMIIDLNAEALLTLMNKRLCGCATKEMQELMMMIRKEVIKTNQEFERFMVPMCQHLGSCKEFVSCKGNCLFFKEVK